MTHRTNRQDNISRIVRALLQIADMDQNDLAEPLGLSESALSRRFSSGRWSVDDLDVLASVFRCPLSTFFMEPADLFRRPDQGIPSTIWEVTSLAGPEQQELFAAAA